MISHVRISLSVLLFLGAFAHKVTPSEPNTVSATILVPAYFYPAGEGLKSWQTLMDSGRKAPVVAIVNPDSGPGKRVDENYAKLFERARASRATLVGYVTLSYGKRPLSAVKADVDSWLFFYPEVRGIFFDEQPSGAEQAAFAQASFAYARERIENGLVISNPGVPCSREYLDGNHKPVVCMFEHEKGFDQFRMPEWAVRLPADRFAVLLYHVPGVEQMERNFDDVIRKHAAYVYITDAEAPMPWGRLPSYWSELVRKASSQTNQTGSKP